MGACESSRFTEGTGMSITEITRDSRRPASGSLATGTAPRPLPAHRAKTNSSNVGGCGAVGAESVQFVWLLQTVSQPGAIRDYLPSAALSFGRFGFRSKHLGPRGRMVLSLPLAESS